jgi:hypothetical protein
MSISAYIISNYKEINFLYLQDLRSESLSCSTTAQISARGVGQGRLLNGSGVLLRYEEIN